MNTSDLEDAGGAQAYFGDSGSGLSPGEAKRRRAEAGADTPEIDDALCLLLEQYDYLKIVRRLVNLSKDFPPEARRRAAILDGQQASRRH